MISHVVELRGELVEFSGLWLITTVVRFGFVELHIFLSVKVVVKFFVGGSDLLPKGEELASCDGMSIPHRA